MKSRVKMKIIIVADPLMILKGLAVHGIRASIDMEKILDFAEVVGFAATL